MDEHYYSMSTLAVVDFCAEQCRRQHVGPGFVSRMFEAYDHLMRQRMSLAFGVTPELILKLGNIVNPNLNNGKDYRKGPVRFEEHDNEAVSYRNIPHLIEQLCAFGHLTADEFYWEFERIHPFWDGNGRVGALLWNYKNSTLDAPVQPPEMVWV